MAAKDYNNIADYLGRKRESHSLSQEALADQLAAHAAIFEGIDGLAISRWERGVVSPSIERQVALMEFFNDEPHLLLGNENYAVKQLPSLSAFHNWMRQNLSYNHVMGGHPYSTDAEVSFDKSGPDNEHFPRWVKLVSRYNENLTRGRECWGEDTLKALVTAQSSQAIFFCMDQQLLGHLILVKVDDNILDALLQGRMTDAELTPAHLLDCETKGNLYLYSAYFGTRNICEDGLTHAFRTLMESPANTAIGVKARANFGVKLMDLLIGEVVSKGEEISGHRDGARYSGKYLEHVSYVLKRKDLITNPTMLNLLRQPTRPEA